MSRSPYFYVERYNDRTKQYELEHPIIWNLEHSAQELADLYPYNGDHELFSIVDGDAYRPVELKGVHYGLPQDCCNEIKQSFEDCSYDSGWNGDVKHITPNAKWFTYADMYIACLETPEIKDYDAIDMMDDWSEDDIPMKRNPLYNLKDRIDAFLEVMDGWDWREDYSRIRIVFWIL